MIRSDPTVNDHCLHRKAVKTASADRAASGISVFLLEELGDARMRCAQLKKYIDEAVTLIEKSEHRDHFFEVGAHLLHGIPDTLVRMDKALSAAAMAAAKLDYEEIKDDLRPEKVEELEKALEDVRIRRVQRRSGKEARSNDALVLNSALMAFKEVLLPVLRHETQEALDQLVADTMIEFARLRAGNHSRMSDKLEKFKPSEATDSEWADQVEEAMEAWFTAMKKTLKTASVGIPEVVSKLERLAIISESTGRVDTASLMTLIASLEGQSKEASAPTEIHGVFRELAASLISSTEPPSRLKLASVLRRVLADTMDISVAQDVVTGKQANAVDYYRTVAKIQRKLNFDILNPLKALSKETDAAPWESLRFQVPGKINSVLDAVRQLESLLSDMAHTEARDFTANTLADQLIESRYEEGKPADPTENMSPEDAKEWKQQTDTHKDEFKSAAHFPTQEALAKYLREHPEAKKSDHSVTNKSIVPKMRNREYSASAIDPWKI